MTELEKLARQLAVVIPHHLRHGLAYRLRKQATPAHIQRILGHSRVSTTLKDGKPKEEDLRAALEEASRGQAVPRIIYLFAHSNHHHVEYNTLTPSSCILEQGTPSDVFPPGSLQEEA